MIIAPEHPTHEQYTQALATIASHGTVVVEPRQWVIAHKIKERYEAQNPRPHLKLVP